MAKKLTLKEYDFLQYKDKNPINQKAHFIDEKVFLELEKFVLANQESTNYLKLTLRKDFGKILQAQNYVGVIQTKDGTTIEILPKIQNITDEESKKILLKMLKTLQKSPFKHFNIANLKIANLPLLEIFISMFLEELAILIRKGIKSDYISKEENLHFLKGKLNIAKQLKQNNVHQERFFVRYEEFSIDRVENRLIKTTLSYLYKKSKFMKNQQKIREFLFIFNDVKTSHNPKLDFTNLQRNRQMKSYETALVYAKTFLLGNSYSPHCGKDISFALLFDMNLLFESYVGAYLKKQYTDVRLQDRGKYLVEMPNKFALRPDIVINKGKETEIVADTKYKNIASLKDVSQADMYQLYAYGKKYQQTKQLYLIYPKTDAVLENNVLKYESDLELKILFFDLSKPEVFCCE